MPRRFGEPSSPKEVFFRIVHYDLVDCCIFRFRSRALRFRRKGRTLDELDDQLYQEAIDETGTVDTTGITGFAGA